MAVSPSRKSPEKEETKERDKSDDSFEILDPVTPIPNPILQRGMSARQLFVP